MENEMEIMYGAYKSANYTVSPRINSIFINFDAIDLTEFKQVTLVRNGIELNFNLSSFFEMLERYNHGK